MLEIQSSSHLQHGLMDGDALPSLEERLAASCKDRFRRVDRFTLLALLGSAECVAGRSLRPDCGIYIGSGTGPMGSNARVQERIGRERQIPKPFDFINTLGSAVGHYVAKNLGVSGQTMFVSRRGESFQVALSIAAVDLALGIVPQALVGAVEECVLPLSDHRRRVGAADADVVGEGTHWLLLQRSDGSSGNVRLLVEHFEERALLAKRLECSFRLSSAERMRLLCSARMDPVQQSGWLDAFDAAAFANPASATVVPRLHDSHDAALMTAWLQQNERGKLGLLCGDERSGWLYLELGA